jgi:hypothetical protein
MCAEWSEKCLQPHEAEKVSDQIMAAIINAGGAVHSVMPGIFRQAGLTLNGDANDNQG